MSAISVSVWLSIFSMLFGNFIMVAATVISVYNLIYLYRVLKHVDRIESKICGKA